MQELAARYGMNAGIVKIFKKIGIWEAWRETGSMRVFG